MQVVALDGRVTSPASGVNHDTPALTPDQLAHIGNGRIYEVEVESLGGASRVLARPILVGETPMVLVVGSSLDSYEHARERLALVLIVASPVMIVLLAGSGWVLAGAALRPVKRMTEEAEEISVNELDHRLAVPDGHDEIAHLASTINGLLERVERSVQHERRFVDDASHELRTPISILRGELELALARPGDHDDVVAALESALDEAIRLGRLADDLLVLARSRTGELALHPRPVELASAATRVARLLGDGVPVDVDGSAQAWADPDRVEQILLNLVSNAKRYACLAGRHPRERAPHRGRRQRGPDRGRRRPGLRTLDDAGHLRALRPSGPGPPSRHGRHRSRPFDRGDAGPISGCEHRGRQRLGARRSVGAPAIPGRPRRVTSGRTRPGRSPRSSRSPRSGRTGREPVEPDLAGSGS